MKYLLFISFNTGLLHNAIYNNLGEVVESVRQLAEEEGAKPVDEKLPNEGELKRHLDKKDDYTGYLSNDTWYHIQSHPVFGG